MDPIISCIIGFHNNKFHCYNGCLVLRIFKGLQTQLQEMDGNMMNY